MRKIIASIPAMMFVGMVAVVVIMVLIGANSRHDRDQNRVTAIRKANQAELADTMCPPYFAGELSFVERRKLSWCEDYRDAPKAELVKSVSPVRGTGQDASYAEWLGQASAGSRGAK